jgi:8-oxo-dGTP pyrophosphatase MutT (NUDIX family)
MTMCCNTQLRLTDLTHAGMPRAASVLLADGERFLFGVRPPVLERDRYLLRLTGIGGWGERDETFAETAAREALEETGSDLHLLDLAQTLVVHAPDDMESVSFPGEVAPAALVYRRFGTEVFDPWSETYSSIAPVAVYVGVLRKRVRIMAEQELPLFMWLYPEQMIALADADEPLQYLLSDGAELFGQADYDADRALVRLTDSIQALVTALGPRAYAFLGDIARATQLAGR